MWSKKLRWSQDGAFEVLPVFMFFIFFQHTFKKGKASIAASQPQSQLFFKKKILCGCSWEKHKIFKKLKSLSKRKLPSVLAVVCFAMKAQSGFKYYPGMPTVWSHYPLAGRSWNVTCGAIMLYWLDESQRVLGSKPHSSNGVHESFGTTPFSATNPPIAVIKKKWGGGNLPVTNVTLSS